MKKKEKWFFALLLSSVLSVLSACNASTGFASDYYDGVKITADEAVVAAYETNREIVGSEKNTFFTDSLLNFLAQPEKDFPDEDVYLGLTKSPYTVGENLPEGRYLVLYEGFAPPDSFIVKSKNGDVLYHYVPGFGMPTFELNLLAGQTIEGTTDAIAGNVLVNDLDNAPNFAPSGFSPELNAEGIAIDNGVWHVGEQLPAGSYDVHFPNMFSQKIPHLYIVSATGDTHLYELMGSQPMEEALSLELTLEEGDVLLLENSFPLVFSSK